MNPLFGILQLDKGEPNGFGQLLPLLQAWLQDAGGFAFLGLIIYIAAAFLGGSRSQSDKLRMPLTTIMLLTSVISLVCYAGWALTFFLEFKDINVRHIGGYTFEVYEPPMRLPPKGAALKVEPPVFHWDLRAMFLMVGGAFSLLGIVQPIIRELPRFRIRRIYALSKLVFKQASRIKALWVILVILGSLPFLFPAQWFFTIKQEDELKVTILVVAVFTAILMKSIAALMASFSLPNDIKNQTVHTIVTKPVERFEIVLGLFFGYTFLMTLVLGTLTLFSLLLLGVNRVSPSAEKQTLTARVPLRGKLEFKSRNDKFEGTNVGREFEYRKYIVGHEFSPQRAIWKFYSLPSELVRAENDRVPVEVTFDIFKLTKGSEDRGGSGVQVGLRFVTHNCPQVKPDPVRESVKGDWKWADTDLQNEYNAELQKLRSSGKNPTDATPGSAGWAEANKLAEKYGIYELNGKPISNNRVISWNIPAGLFRNAMKNPPKDPNVPLFEVYVKCESGGQMLGMAEPDLYILGGNQSFTQNYIKSVFGLWCRVCLIIGLAVACSTYLSGVISLLATAFLFLSGYFGEHVREVALNRSVGGGPLDSMSKLIKAELPTGPTSEGAGAKVLGALDQVFAWGIRRYQNIVPNVESFSWTEFVQEGFNINLEYLVANLLVLVGYLLPWGILSYYLIKSREIASS